MSQVHKISTPSFLGEISLGERSFGICKAQPNQLSMSWNSVQGPMATAKVSKLRCRVSWFTHCAQRQLSLQNEICWLALRYILCSMLSYAACESAHTGAIILILQCQLAISLTQYFPAKRKHVATYNSALKGDPDSLLLKMSPLEPASRLVA